MEYRNALNKIFEGNCLLILGSGFSCGCEIAGGEKMPRADELCKLLDAESGENSGGDLGLSAESFIEVRGRSALCSLLKTLFTPIELREAQLTIGSEKWRRVYTTNYDDIIEKAALKGHKKRVESVSLNDNPQDFNDKRNLVVHLNGRLENLTSDTLNDEFKLTKGSYLFDTFKNSKWIDLFKLDLTDTDAVFIVGLSLDYDLDLARLVYSEEDKNKIFIIVWEKEKSWNIKKLQKFGNVLPLGREQFAKDIIDAKASYIPTTFTPLPQFHAFRMVELTESRPVIDDELVRKLFFWGEINDAAIQYSLLDANEKPYFIHRTRIDTVVNLINNGEENILIHSAVGNGKTMFVKGLSVKLAKLGYRIFIFDHETDSVTSEIENICAIADRRTAIVVEDYSRYRNIIKDIVTFRSDTIVIVTDRTAVNDLHSDWLNEVFDRKFHEINLNRLEDEEIAAIISILDSINLWGELAAEKQFKKQEYLERKCKRELRSLLLNIFNTKSVRDHLSSIFKDLKGDTLKTTVLLLLASYSSFRLNLYDLQKVLSDEFVTSSAFQKNSVIKEFLDFSTGECKVTSSLLGEFVLRNFVKPADLFSILKEAFMGFDSNGYKYRNVLKSLSNHSTILSLIGYHSEEVRQMVPLYYDSIKNCRWCKRNPHFWLQYAIAMLDKKDYPEAELYFQNAYSYLRETDDFNKIQIDNHYARYLLENAINNQDGNYWESFKSTHDILTDSKYLKDKKYYPYKVGKLYEPFYRKYKSEMDSVKLLQFKQKSAQLLEMLDKYLKTNPPVRKEVEDARRGLTNIIEDKVELIK